MKKLTIKDNSSNYLLVYGTLLAAGNTYADFLLNHSQPAGSGSFPGLLYDLGEYPGAIYSAVTSSKVYGQIRLMTNADDVLRILDEYEGFGPNEEQPNLFTRELIEVDTDNGDKVACWVYLFNRSVDGFGVIEGGRYG